MKTLKDSILEECGAETLIAAIDDKGVERDLDDILIQCESQPYLDLVLPNHWKFTKTETFCEKLDKVAIITEWSRFTITYTFSEKSNAYVLTLAQ